MLGDWKRACTSRTLVDSAPAGSQALALFFSAPMSFPDNGRAITSTTSQKPTTTHLVQLPAGISVSLLATLFIGSPGFRCLTPSSYATMRLERDARTRQAGTGYPPAGRLLEGL